MDKEIDWILVPQINYEALYDTVVHIADQNIPLTGEDAYDFRDLARECLSGMLSDRDLR